MFQGLTTRLSRDVVASAATIVPSSDIVKVTGSTAIATIVPPFGGQSGILVLVPTDGSVATLTTGNIAVAVTMAINRATVLVYDHVANTWYPGAIS